MLKSREIRSHLVTSLIYFLVLVPLVVLQWRFNLIFFLIGIILGTFILDLDHLIFAFYQKPEESSSQRIREALGRRNWRELLRVLEEVHQEHTELVFHQAIFQVIFLVFSFFIVTSTLSLLAKGIVMAANLHLLKDEWQDQKRDAHHLNKWLFWQVGQRVDLQTQQLYLIGVSVVFLVLNWVLV